MYSQTSPVPAAGYYLRRSCLSHCESCGRARYSFKLNPVTQDIEERRTVSIAPGLDVLYYSYLKATTVAIYDCSRHSKFNRNTREINA